MISANYEYINELNIFPVPDGDTGSNLRITVEGANNEIANKSFNSLNEFAKAYSRSLLMNARGNSGVIFSQIIKGFVANFWDENEYSLGQLATSLENACNYAYKSLASPIEGTILTVIRLTSEAFKNKATTFKDFKEAFKFVVDEANIALSKTPEMLEELKQAKVVDSGGYGLVKFFEGIYANLTGETNTNIKTIKNHHVEKTRLLETFVDNNEGFGYCCEFIMLLGSKVTLNQSDKYQFNQANFKKELNAIGDSLVMVIDENMVKVHLHTIEPYKLLQIGAKYGEFSKVKIENMTLQFAENNPDTQLGQTYAKPNEKQNLTVPVLGQKPKIIATVSTKVLMNKFINEFKVDKIINCESSGTPSIQEFLDAFKQVRSTQILLVVHDSNILLAAQQAAQLVKNTLNIQIINARDISVSFLCCLAYNPIDNFNTNVKLLTQISKKTYGKVAKANKDVVYFSVNIKSGNYIGLVNKDVITANKSMLVVIKNIIDKIKNERSNRKNPSKNLYLFVGNDVPIETIRTIEKYVAEQHNLKLEVINTGQTLYFFNVVY